MNITGDVVHFPTASEPDARLMWAAEILSLLAADHRLMIARALQTGSRTLSELSQATGLAFKPLLTSISTLLHERLVAVRRRGDDVVYELGNARIGAVILLADAFVTDHSS